MRYVLIGTEGKRYQYFLKAWQEGPETLTFLDIQDPDLVAHLRPGDRIKIDPMKNDSIYLADLGENMAKYRRILQGLQDFEIFCQKRPGQSGGGKPSPFLNSPQSLAQTLNKKECKQILVKNQVRVTPMLDFAGKTYGELVAYLAKHNLSQVFIKPNLGSGGAGILALRYHPGQNRALGQTTISQLNLGGRQGLAYVNTKRLHLIKDQDQIRDLVNFLLDLGSIVEIWLPKATCKGLTYDLRVVYQWGKIAFIQARGGRGPITNLHLNNLPLAFKDLGLKEESLAEIDLLCRRASQSFANLRVAGYDILLEKNGQEAYIIEVNGQGDLIYQDIYDQNQIYKEQVEMMVNLW